MKKLYKKMIVLLIMSMLLLNTLPVLATTSAQSTKEENIYANLTASGEVQNIYVVNSFFLEQEGQILDYGSYENLRNLSNLEDIKQEGNCLTIQAKQGKNDYQGTLQTKQIPWNIQVSYLLEGTPIEASALAGKSGKVTIKIKVTKNQAVDATFFDNYLLQANLSLNSEKCKNIEAQGATIANVGNQKQITYNFMAGTEKEIEISADVEDFELVDGISFNGLLMKMAIDNLDTSVLTDKVSQLKTGVNNLNTGMNKLKTGSSKYKVALGEMATKTKGLPSQSTQVANGIKSNLNGVKQIEAQLVNTKTTTVENLQTQVTKQIDSELEKDKNYQALKQSNPQMATYMRQTLINTSLQTAKTVETTYAQKVKENMSTLTSGLKQLETGLSNLSNAYEKMDEGIQKVTTGIQSLNNGYTDIQEGITTATKGSNILYDKTKNLDSQVDEQIEDMLASFENKDYQAISFVDKQNTNISNVQFIIQTEGIQKVEQKQVEDSVTEESSFWEKFMDLFKK